MYGELDAILEEVPNTSTFFSPFYTYHRSGGSIRAIRKKLGWSSEAVQEYRDTHMEYIFLKPQNPEDYKEWLKYMYYNTSFNGLCKTE
jgi:hypothetical protein